MAAVRTGWIVGCSWTGDKPRWQAADLDYLEQCLEQEARTYSQQLAQKLEQERQVKLSADRIRRLMKKGLAMAHHSHKHKQDPIAKAIKQADFDTLKQAEREGHLLLKYLDESGFCL